MICHLTKSLATGWHEHTAQVETCRFGKLVVLLHVYLSGQGTPENGRAETGIQEDALTGPVIAAWTEAPGQAQAHRDFAVYSAK